MVKKLIEVLLQQIIDRMMELNLSIYQITEKMNGAISQGVFSMIINGELTPTILELQAIANALNMNLEINLVCRT